MLQEVPKKVELAFDRWLKGDVNGKKSGRPRFKGAGQYKTFTFPQFKRHHFDGNKITLSKIGDIKVIVHRQIPDGFENYFSENKIIKLNILMCSLKQTMHTFHEQLVSAISCMRMKRNEINGAR